VESGFSRICQYVQEGPPRFEAGWVVLFIVPSLSTPGGSTA
jgi:hypothetical protein